MNQPQQYFVQLLGTRPGWPDDMTPDEEKVMTEHYYYLKDLVKKRKVYLAGPVFDAKLGLVILSVDSEREAKEIMDSEPSVKAGLHTYTMSAMRVSLLVDHQSAERYVDDPSDRVLSKEIIVPGTLDGVWKAWTSTEGVKSFFAPDASVELRLGGPYEIYFVADSPPGLRGSEDCRILSYVPMKMLAFEWNAPPSFGDLRHKRTQVVVRFDSHAGEGVRVSLVQYGWGRGVEWNRLFDYFDRAWGYVLGNLRKRFEQGPLEWR